VAISFFTETTPWEQARRDLRFTTTRVAVRRQHASLAEPLHGLLMRWTHIDRERRDADDLLIDADAVICAESEALDDAVLSLAAQLLHEGDHDPADLAYQAYFPRDPGEITGLGLESAISRTRELHAVAREIVPSFEVAAILVRIAQIEERGIEALIIREQARQNAVRVEALMRAWKDSANDARRLVESSLSAHARLHHLQRGYADAFFPAVARSRRTRRGGSPREREVA